MADKNIDKHKKKRKKKKVSYYKRAVIIYCILLFIVIVVVSILLWNKLASYQRGVDDEAYKKDYKKLVRQAPQEAFENYYEGMTIEDWIGIWKNSQTYTFDDDATIKQFLEENITSKDVSLWKSPTSTESEPIYLLSDGDKVIAIFTLQGAELNWEVSNVELRVSANEACELTVPTGSIVSCNDVTLGAEHIANTVSLNELGEYAANLNNPVSYDVYSLAGMIKEPKLTVYIPDEKYVITTDVNGKYVIAANDSSMDTYKQQAEAFIKSLLHYYSYGKNSLSENMAAAISHVASDSEAARVIRSSLDGVRWCNYDGANYETSVSQVYCLADNCYAVDVSYRNTNIEEPKTETYRVYFIDLGSGYKIYSFSLM